LENVCGGGLSVRSGDEIVVVVRAVGKCECGGEGGGLSVRSGDELVVVVRAVSHLVDDDGMPRDVQQHLVLHPATPSRGMSQHAVSIHRGMLVQGGASPNNICNLMRKSLDMHLNSYFWHPGSSPASDSPLHPHPTCIHLQALSAHLHICINTDHIQLCEEFA